MRSEMLAKARQQAPQDLSPPKAVDPATFYEPEPLEEESLEQDKRAYQQRRYNRFRVPKPGETQSEHMKAKNEPPADKADNPRKSPKTA